jgi:hypothetical protein
MEWAVFNSPVYSCEDNSTKNDSGLCFLNVIVHVIVKYLSISTFQQVNLIRIFSF